jgi:hypothetical protein
VDFPSSSVCVTTSPSFKEKDEKWFTLVSMHVFISIVGRLRIYFLLIKREAMKRIKG